MKFSTGKTRLGLIFLTSVVFLPTAGAQIFNEGFNGFDSGTRPAGWIFAGCNTNSDCYTIPGYYGAASPSVRLEDTNAVTTETFAGGSSLRFWIRGTGIQLTSSLLVEEFYSAAWNTLVNLNPLPIAGAPEGPYDLNAASTRIRFTYTKFPGEGNVAFDDVRVDASGAPSPSPAKTAPPTPVKTKTPTAPPTKSPTVPPTRTPTVTPTPWQIGCLECWTEVLYFSENFETWPLSGWTITDNPMSVCSWQSGTVAGNPNNTGGSGNFADADRAACAGAVMSELRSPELDLSLNENPWLEFKSDIYITGETMCRVYAVVDDSTWWELTAINYSSRGPETFTLPLYGAAFEDNVRVSFEYFAVGADQWWQIDEVRVRGCQLNPPTKTPTPTWPPTRTPTRTPTPIPTATAAKTPVKTPTAAPTRTPVKTPPPTAAPTRTIHVATPPPTPAPTRTPVKTPSPKPTGTLWGTLTPPPTRTPTATPYDCLTATGVVRIGGGADVPAGSWVRLAFADGVSAPAPVQSPDGTFSVPGCTHLADGTVRVEARAPGCFPWFAQTGYAGWGDLAGIEVELEPLPGRVGVASNDFDGDGYDDIAVYRPSVRKWLVRGLTRFYFGDAGDDLVPADYDGDGTAEVAVFRGRRNVWLVRGLTRIYYGDFMDIALPADPDGNGTYAPGIFRHEAGKWLTRGGGQTFFGQARDFPLHWRAGTGTVPAVFRSSAYLWLARGTTRQYHGAAGDLPVSGEYAAAGETLPAVFRPGLGVWIVSGMPRFYFGSSSDTPLPLRIGGDTDRAATFRPAAVRWSVRGVTTLFYGQSADLPLAR